MSRIDVTNCPKIFAENRGVNTKEWILCNGKEALFKETQIKEKNGDSTYADYGEVIVTDICNLLGIPCAQTELAIREGKIGCLSYSSYDRKNEEQFDIGAVISNIRLGFDSKSMEDHETKESYCVEMILEGLESVASSKKEFAGLRRELIRGILTDALIDHYDRNPSNLAIIRNGRSVRLMYKYDNGTALSISVPEDALDEMLHSSDDERIAQSKIRENVASKIGYLGKKFVTYPDLESFIINYYYSDAKDFMEELPTRLSNEAIEGIFEDPKYAELPTTHKEMIKGKLRVNRDAMLERYRTISKKVVIDNSLYSKAAIVKFQNSVKRGRIQSSLPEYYTIKGVADTDTDYGFTLDEQVLEKIQNTVDITQLSRYFKMPIKPLTKREASLLKWVSIIEAIQKANPTSSVFEEITERLGFLSDDITVMRAIIKDKFKDENDLLEAREIIYGEEGIGEQNINLYIAKKFVDAASMRKDIIGERMEQLRAFVGTMQDAVELEHIVQDKIPSVRKIQNLGLSDEQAIVEIQFGLAQEYRKNPRLRNNQIFEMAKSAAEQRIEGEKVKLANGIYVPTEVFEDLQNHTYKTKDGKSLAIYTESTKMNNVAKANGIDYFVQIAEHPAGEGVTLCCISNRASDFPQELKDFIENFKHQHPEMENGIIYRTYIAKKSKPYFVISSTKDPNAKIPNITVEKMAEKVQDMFCGKEKSRIIGE